LLKLQDILDIFCSLGKLGVQLCSVQYLIREKKVYLIFIYSSLSRFDLSDTRRKLGASKSYQLERKSRPESTDPIVTFVTFFSLEPIFLRTKELSRTSERTRIWRQKKIQTRPNLMRLFFLENRTFQTVSRCTHSLCGFKYLIKQTTWKVKFRNVSKKAKDCYDVTTCNCNMASLAWMLDLLPCCARVQRYFGNSMKLCENGVHDTAMNSIKQSIYVTKPNQWKIQNVRTLNDT
jgi:hypothetical protein